MMKTLINVNEFKQGNGLVENIGDVKTTNLFDVDPYHVGVSQVDNQRGVDPKENKVNQLTEHCQSIVKHLNYQQINDIHQFLQRAQ